MKGSIYFLIVLMAIMVLAIAFSLTLDYFSPKVLPIAFSIVGLVLSAIQLRRELSARDKPKADAASTTEKPKQSPRGLLINLAWIGGFVLAIYLIGVVISVFLFVLTYVRWLGGRWRVAIIAAIVTPALIYGLFQMALDVSLPQGWLFSWLGF